MRTSSRLLTILSPALLLAACDPERSLTADDTATLAERLTDGAELHVVEPSLLEVTGRNLAEPEKVGRAHLAITAGQLAVHLDEHDVLTVDALELRVADVTVQPGTRPIALTDLRLTLSQAAGAKSCWSSTAEQATADLDVALALDWAIRLDTGEVVPLGTQHLATVPALLTVRLVDGHVRAVLDVVGTGEVWRWADLLVLEDLWIDVRAGDVFQGPVE